MFLMSGEREMCRFNQSVTHVSGEENISSNDPVAKLFWEGKHFFQWSCFKMMIKEVKTGMESLDISMIESLFYAFNFGECAITLMGQTREPLIHTLLISIVYFQLHIP